MRVARWPTCPSFGSVAILTGESSVVSSRNGKDTRSHFRLVALYVNQDTAIQLMHFQSTNLTNTKLVSQEWQLTHATRVAAIKPD
jgi:hypothetical protein